MPLTVTLSLRPLQVIFPDDFRSLRLACGIIKALAFVESQVPSTRQLTPLSPQRSPLLKRPSAVSRPPTRTPIFLAPTTQSSSDSAATSQSHSLLPLPPPLTTERPEADDAPSKNETLDPVSDQDLDEDVVQVLPGRKRKPQAKVQIKGSDQDEDDIQVLPRRVRKPSAKVQSSNKSSDQEEDAIQAVPGRKRKRPAQVE